MTTTEEAKTAGIWRCPDCRCHSYAHVHEQKQDGSFGPGPKIRCVNCKALWPDPALAAPRTDSAESTAGEDGEFAASRAAGAIPSLEWTLRALEMLRAQSQKGDKLWVRNTAWNAIQWLQQLSATPAPSSPGVPDSVRALSGAAYPGPWIDDEDDILGAQDADRSWGGGDIICDMPSEGEDSRKHWPAKRALIVAAVNFVRTLISAHPAGQSATDEHDHCEICGEPLLPGQCVIEDVNCGTVHYEHAGPERDSFVRDVETGEPLGPNDPIPQGYIYEPERPAGQSTGQGAEDRDRLTEIHRSGQKIIDGLKDAVAFAKGETSRARMLRIENGKVVDAGPAPNDPEAGKMAMTPAPDSTRTGQVETGTRNKWIDWRGAVEGIDRSKQIAAQAVRQVRESEGDDTNQDVADNVCWMLGLDHLWQHVEALRAALADKQAPAVAAALREEAKRLHDKADALAARPAAPEAQGAWPDPQPMDTAPDDGTNVVALVGKRITTVQCSKHFANPPHDLGRNVWSEINYDSLMPCEPKCWWPFPSNTKSLPAPPASSGQESA